MKILILNRSNLATTPYLDWLGADDEAVLLTSAGAASQDPDLAAAELAGYEEVVTFDRFHENPAVETAALELHGRHGFDALIAMNEFDLLRAARLREAMGVAGQQRAQAEAFRDKLRMKELLTAAGIPVAPFAPIAHATALHTFVAEHGYPVVVKPRRGAGSMGVEVLRGADDLTAYLEAHPELGGDDGAPLLAEKYIEHDLFHIDGLIVDGTPVLIWPSACSSCLAYREGAVLTSAMLDPEDPLTESLRRLTLQALATLSGSETLAFHAEAFLTPNGDLLLNEIACRVGGGKIYEATRLAFGVDLVREYVQAVGSGRTGREPVSRPERAGGFAIFPGSPGTLVAAPQECPVDGVDQYRLNVPVGTVLGRAEHSSARIASVVVAGRNRAEVENSLETAVRWFSNATEIEPLAASEGE
ncbi:biotin carboxylase [Kitasatospora sp. MAP12-15]|uniref:ATP-grasp domain-containing protein n=1 Tax=unclassified Kitasatospora TaxID=2633591 RepID=UPI002476C8E1|nr:ATP-grasp domain-containing protein [Kitasatospora sp. MAP12-44]MDH6111840.1 biotin carboxylase [Kitasatospora sp. MAP12-44]